MTRDDCCRRPEACPAHANGDCDHTPPPVEVHVDEHTAAFLTALYGPDWADAIAAQARTEPT